MPRKKRNCARCGRDVGYSDFASVWSAKTGEVFYCHADDPSCYELAAPLQTAFYEAQNRFIAESSAAYPDVDPDEAQRLATEARLEGIDRETRSAAHYLFKAYLTVVDPTAPTVSELTKPFRKEPSDG